MGASFPSGFFSPPTESWELWGRSDLLGHLAQATRQLPWESVLFDTLYGVPLWVGPWAGAWGSGDDEDLQTCFLPRRAFPPSSNQHVSPKCPAYYIPVIIPSSSLKVYLHSLRPFPSTITLRPPRGRGPHLSPSPLSPQVLAQSLTHRCLIKTC